MRYAYQFCLCLSGFVERRCPYPSKVSLCLRKPISESKPSLRTSSSSSCRSRSSIYSCRRRRRRWRHRSRCRLSLSRSEFHVIARNFAPFTILESFLAPRSASAHLQIVDRVVRRRRFHPMLGPNTRTWRVPLKGNINSVQLLLHLGAANILVIGFSPPVSTPGKRLVYNYARQRPVSGVYICILNLVQCR